MVNRRGWMRILEATIAIMIVAGVLIFLYSKQMESGNDPGDYFHNFHKDILSDISSNVSLRLMALNDQFDALNSTVDSRLPDNIGFNLRVCALGDVCRMDSDVRIATLDKDIFVEDLIISSDVGDGTGNEIYNPKKIRLFLWKT